MRTLTPNSIPVFLGNAGIGLPHGMVPPQIRGFDVYYKAPVLVGFHVMGNPEHSCPGIEIIPQELFDDAPKVVGFYCYAVGTEECCEEPALMAMVKQEDNAPKVLGFYAFAVSDDTIKEIGLLAQIEETESSPKVLGFYAMGVT